MYVFYIVKCVAFNLQIDQNVLDGQTPMKPVSFFKSLSSTLQLVATTTSRRHAALSCARRFAVARPRFSGPRSVSTVLSHDCLGRPGLRLQSAGVSAVQTRRTR